MKKRKQFTTYDHRRKAFLNKYRLREYFSPLFAMRLRVWFRHVLPCHYRFIAAPEMPPPSLFYRIATTSKL
jgi:hypothetical protein